MHPIPLQRTLAISSLVYAASLWGLMWYPYRLLNEAGVGGIASSLFTYCDGKFGITGKLLFFEGNLN